MSDADRFLILDIETVRDEHVLTHFPERAQSITVPPPIANRILAISFLSGCIEGDGHAARFIAERGGSLGTAETPEADLLREFWRGMKGRLPLIVTWNGRCFDIPVILHRSLLRGVSAAPWFQTMGSRYDGYAYRYGHRHIDLMDVMADYGAIRSYGLNVVASILGLPGKIGGHGSEIQGMFECGELEKIRAYCECDCLNLFGLYLRWCMLVGRIDETGLDDCRKLFEAFLEKERPTRPHYGEFLDAWRKPAIIPELAGIGTPA
jgi:predicted PolB exonuclease-like 3'-5' exonuclease